jgi:ribosome biogenesis GTPase A
MPAPEDSGSGSGAAPLAVSATAQEEGAASLRDYTLARQQLTALAHAAKQALRERGDDAGSAEAQKLLERLAADRFNLAVVGQFKRGKSSLMNAILGRDLLPTGVLPLTSTITTLCYGPRDRAYLKRQGWLLDQEINLSELADYVTERGNPGNVKGLREVRIEVPLPFLRRGLYLVDTPGIGSSREENTATTLAFLPEADAIVFVTSVEAPLSQAEVDFLEKLRDYGRRLFIVVNKIDLLTQAERLEVLDYLRSGIGRALSLAEVRLFPLSARQALAAKLSADSESLQESGLPDLEQALVSFLGPEKSRVFLTGLLERLLGLLPTSDPSLAELVADASALQAELAAGDLAAFVEKAGERAAARALAVAAPAESEAVEPDSGLVLATNTCPVCAYQTQALFDFFVQTQHKLANGENARLLLAKERGFCARHTWQFEQIASPQTISEGYAPLIESVAGQLRRLAGWDGPAAAAAMVDLFPNEASCPACRLLRQAEAAALKQLLSQLSTAQGRERYRRSAGLCLPHLRAALELLHNGEASYLLEAHVQRLEELAEDMRSFVLKREALRRDLCNSEEETAWRRALIQVAGEPNAKPSLPEDDSTRHQP